MSCDPSSWQYEKLERTDGRTVAKTLLKAQGTESVADTQSGAAGQDESQGSLSEAGQGRAGRQGRHSGLQRLQPVVGAPLQPCVEPLPPSCEPSTPYGSP